MSLRTPELDEGILNDISNQPNKRRTTGEFGCSSILAMKQSGIYYVSSNFHLTMYIYSMVLINLKSSFVNGLFTKVLVQITEWCVLHWLSLMFKEHWLLSATHRFDLFKTTPTKRVINVRFIKILGFGVFGDNLFVSVLPEVLNIYKVCDIYWVFPTEHMQ